MNKEIKYLNYNCYNNFVKYYIIMLIFFIIKKNIIQITMTIFIILFKLNKINF